MKHIIFLLFGCIAITSLKAQKIAHLDYDSLISLMPETKLATEAANAYLTALNTEFSNMQAEYDKKLQAFKSDANLSEVLLKTRKLELEQLETRIKDFQEQARADYNQKQMSLTLPIMEKVKAAISSVAKEMGYRYVLDKSKRSTFILYSVDSDNILAAVKKKLDSMPMATLPLPTNAR